MALARLPAGSCGGEWRGQHRAPTARCLCEPREQHGALLRDPGAQHAPHGAPAPRGLLVANPYPPTLPLPRAPGSRSRPPGGSRCTAPVPSSLFSLSPGLPAHPLHPGVSRCTPRTPGFPARTVRVPRGSRTPGLPLPAPASSRGSRCAPPEPSRRRSPGAGQAPRPRSPRRPFRRSQLRAAARPGSARCRWGRRRARPLPFPPPRSRYLPPGLSPTVLPAPGPPGSQRPARSPCAREAPEGRGRSPPARCRTGDRPQGIPGAWPKLGGHRGVAKDGGKQGGLPCALTAWKFLPTLLSSVSERGGKGASPGCTGRALTAGTGGDLL